MHDSCLLRLFVFNQPKKCFEKGKKNIGFNNEKTFYNNFDTFNTVFSIFW